jgi:hypothetical protein
MHTVFWFEHLYGRDHLEDVGIDGKIVMEWMLRKQVGWCRLDSPGLGQESVEGYCEYSNEPSNSVKREEFLHQWSDC